MKNEIVKIREQLFAARTDKKRAELNGKMREMSDKNPDAFAAAMIELAKETADRAEELALREQLGEILPAVSLAYIAKTYFGKTRQWLYQRVNGSKINGKPVKLNEQELRTLDDALKDIGGKLSTLNVAS